MVLSGPLNGTYSSGYGNITTEVDNCYVPDGSNARITTPKTISLNQGFRVISGGTFSAETLDSDSDGLPDAWEYAYFGNLNQTASGNYDNDELTNLTEYIKGTDPTVYDLDSDADGLPDWYEIQEYGNLNHTEYDGYCGGCD